jgi:hypothetical protein
MPDTWALTLFIFICVHYVSKPNPAHVIEHYSKPTCCTFAVVCERSVSEAHLLYVESGLRSQSVSSSLSILHPCSQFCPSLSRVLAFLLRLSTIACETIDRSSLRLKALLSQSLSNSDLFPTMVRNSRPRRFSLVDLSEISSHGSLRYELPHPSAVQFAGHTVPGFVARHAHPQGSVSLLRSVCSCAGIHAVVTIFCHGRMTKRFRCSPKMKMCKVRRLRMRSSGSDARALALVPDDTALDSHGWKF